MQINLEPQFIHLSKSRSRLVRARRPVPSKNFPLNAGESTLSMRRWTDPSSNDFDQRVRFQGRVAASSDPSGRGWRYCGSRIRVVGVTKRDPKFVSAAFSLSSSFAVTLASFLTCVPYRQGFGIIRSFFVSSRPVASTFRFRVRLSRGVGQVFPSTAGAELYPPSAQLQGVCEENFGEGTKARRHEGTKARRDGGTENF